MKSSQNISLLLTFTILSLALSVGLCRTTKEPTPLIIPFEVLEDKIVVQASVHQRLGYFIIDTGYPSLALNNKIFNGKVSQSARHGIGSTSGQVMTTLVHFKLGHVEIKSAYAEIIDLQRIVATRRVQFLGLIGVQLLREYCVIFDFGKKQLILYSTKNQASLNYPPDMEEAQIFRLSTKGHLLCLDMAIADVPFRLALDSGAGANLFDQRKTDRILPAIVYLDKRKLGGIGPNDVVVDKVLIGDIKLDQISFPAMATLLCDLQHLNRNLPGKRIDGVMGFPFFQAHRLAIDFKKKKLLVWPKSPPPDPFHKPIFITKGSK